MPESKFTERGVFYGRKSNEDDGKSVDQQRDWARETCPKEGVDLVKEFADQAVAGHDTAGRTDFHRMLEFCREQARLKRPIGVIASWHTNRFSRADSQETSWFIWEFRKAGVKHILTAQRRYDLSRKEDRALLNLEQDFTNQQYVIDLAQAVTRGKLDAARAGLWNGGRAPLGYRLVHEWHVNSKGKRVRRPRLEVSEKEADLVREMFRAYAAGETSLYRMARDLNARGVKPPRAAKWSPSSVRSILVNEVYLGTHVWNKTDQGKFFGVVDLQVTGKSGVRDVRHPCARRPRADQVRVDDHHEALVDRDTFDAVQRRLVENRKGRNRADRADYALRGLLRCGVCRLPMVGKRADWGDRAPMYRCGNYNAHGPGCGCGTNYIFEAPLVKCIGVKLQAGLFNAAKLAELRQEMLDALAGERPDAREEARARRELAALEEKIATASERCLTEKDEAVAAVHRGTIRQLLDRKLAVEAQIRDAELHRVEEPDVEAVISRAMDYTHRLDKALERMKTPDLRIVLRDMIDHVELHFRTETQGGKLTSHFVRGFVFVRPGVLPDVSSGACRGHATCESSCRPDTSSDRR
jgi:DNA invertase Pin-like site-specific DNA recombinase